ncbi:MAG: hypothetical protein WBF17_24880 [Phycisphaerae bacterium]
MGSDANDLSRRRFMKRALGIPGAGVLAGLGLEERALLAGSKAEAAAAPAERAIRGLPAGKIGKLTISRLICGGNLFVGSAHSRKLMYVSALMRSYFSPERIMDTLELCEANGVNTAIMRCDDHIVGVVQRYRRERGGKIQWLAQTYPKVNDLTQNIKIARDNGAIGAFMQGGIGDRFVKDGQVELIGKVIDFVKQNGMIAGVGSHSLDVPRAVEKAALEPDFYFKTCNDVDYNSQSPREIAELMKAVKKPWIAFKVLGAGVVRPRDGFELALKAGADFLAVGMFDFQVRQDAAIVRELLAKGVSRERPWRS